MKYSDMQEWEKNSRRKAQRKQYLKRKANGTQKHYKSGTQCESQKWRNSKDYREWRKAVLQVGECSMCSTNINLEAHHILSASEYPELRFELKNGDCICNECHKKEHAVV